jgi:hypothetical protein
MFVTLARHYRYKKVTDEDGVVNKPSKCASWAISQGIDAKSLSKEKIGPASPAGRKAVVRSLKCLENAGILTAIQIKNLMKSVDAKFPEAEDAEAEEDE